MARNKQIGPEIKLYQIDTMIYLTTKNIVSKIEMFSKFLEWGGIDQANSARINNARAVERFDKNYRISDIKDLNTIDGQANETWLRKSGFLVSTDSKYELSPIATAIIENKISIAEYCFLILSKQWVIIKKPGEPSEYKANLLALVLEILSNHGDVPAADFVTTINQDIVDKYIDEYDGLALSNQEASRFIIEPLLLSGILVAEDNVYRLSVKHIELIENYLLNYNKIKNPNELPCLEESYLNCFEYGVFDIIDADNEPVYANLYPGLFKQTASKDNAVDDSMARQQIYYGAPGTGKSHTIKRHTEGESVVRTTFHPDSDYSTFVGCYKPTTKEVEMRDVTGKVIVELGQPVTENRIIYQFVDQAFLQAYIKAWKFYAEAEDGVYPKKQFLIIEEINRGNCAQIFGDLFQLLDRNDSGFSEYFIHADKDMQKHLSNAFKGCFLKDSHKDTINSLYPKEDYVVAKILLGEILLLPNNLYIWATMNTSDQSLFPIDSAFKRRWDWEYEPIKYKNTDWIINIQNNSYSWESFQREINKRVFAANNSEDKMLGDYFVNPADGIITEKMLLNKILFYLWNDVCKDGEGDIFRTSATDEISFSELHSNGGTDKLIAMMAYLGIPELDYREENADTDAGTDTKKKLPKYSINDGQELYSTPKAVQYIIGDFAQSHQDMPVDEMISLWNEISERKNCLVESWTPSPNDNQTFATKRRTEIKWGDKSAWVINGWTEELFNTFIKNVREKIGVEIKKAE